MITGSNKEPGASEQRGVAVLILGIGLVAISSAAVLIRMASAPASVVAAGRMALASVLLAPFFWFRARREMPSLLVRPRLLALVLLSGCFLAGHFALWFESLSHTTVVSSVLLVTMNPVFLGIASPLILRERLSRRVVVAISLGILGAVAISLKPGAGFSLVQGNLLAVGGAVMYSGYLLVGRRVRARVPLLSYTYLVYTTAALLLLGMVAALQQPLAGWPRSSYLYMALLAILPQLIGHSAFNWALARYSAPIVSLIILGEPVGAGTLAWVVLREPPVAAEIAGGILILGAVALATTESVARVSARD